MTYLRAMRALRAFGLGTACGARSPHTVVGHSATSSHHTPRIVTWEAVTVKTRGPASLL